MREEFLNKVEDKKRKKHVRTDSEKAASGASDACGHFVGIHAILRTF